MGDNYDAKQLKILHGLEAVVERPGMYIGATDTNGLHHLVWEIIDNAVDEANEGYGKNIYVTIHDDGSIEIRDEGRGVPYDLNKKEKKNGFEIVYQTLHGGGKFDENLYKTASGLHGVGAAVTNALSEWMEVHSYRDGIDHFGRFEQNGKKFSGIKSLGPTNQRGTDVRFYPDHKKFDDINFNFDKIAQHLDDKACLTKGVTFHLTDERSGRKQQFFYANGLSEYFNRRVIGKELLIKTIQMQGKSDDGIRVEAVFGFIKDNYDEKIISFANGVRTGEAGYHVTGFKKALTACFNSFAINHNEIKANESLDGECLREGLIAILSVWVPEHLLQFEGQTKGKLGTKEALNAVDSIIEGKLSYYLEEHVGDASAVVKKTTDEMKVKAKTENERKKERELIKNKVNFVLSDKLTPCSSKVYSNNELFIVEGDSASGSAKKGRNPTYQAILPLRGKPLNTTDIRDVKTLLGNKEIATLIYTIGAGFDSDFKVKDIHYDKVIIMTDADDDGSHIQSLLITFFYNHMKPLIEHGHLYVACPPLYRIKNAKGTKVKYCWSDEELRKARAEFGSGYKIGRFKGLGEMNYSELAATTMSRENRKLLQVQLVDDDDAADKVKMFLSDKEADRRKEWIENNIDFTVVDNFKEEIAREN